MLIASDYWDSIHQRAYGMLIDKTHQIERLILNCDLSNNFRMSTGPNQ